MTLFHSDESRVQQLRSLLLAQSAWTGAHVCVQVGSEVRVQQQVRAPRVNDCAVQMSHVLAML
jgi:hypothetical protein